MSRPLAFSYIRMSTEIQIRGDSLRRQKEASATYAAANNLELAESFKLEDIGRSAFKGDHVSQGSLGLFLKKIESGEIPKGSYLLVESLDRLSREAVEHAAVQFFGILKAGVNVVTLADNRVYLAGQTEFSDIIYSIVVMARAHDESKTKSLRVSAAWQNKRRNAQQVKMTRVAPAWMKLANDRSHFILDEDRARTVKLIFDEADAGKGSYQIARALNMRGVPPIGRSNGWHESYVTKLLTNRAVIGEFQPHTFVDGKRLPDGESVEGYYPAIVSVEQFERIQLARKRRLLRGAGPKGQTQKNLFSGVAKCGYCDGRMLLVDKGDGPKGGVYLRCDNSRRGHECTASSWRLSHFETAFLYFVRELDLESVLSSSQDDAERQRLEDRVVVVQALRERWRTARDGAFDLLKDSLIDTLYVGTRIKEISAEIDKCTAELAALADTLAELANRKSLSEMEVGLQIERVLNLADVDARTKVADWIRLQIKELLLYPDGIDPDDKHDANKTFSVLFETGIFRTITVDPIDPKKHHFAVYADSDGWREE